MKITIKIYNVFYKTNIKIYDVNKKLVYNEDINNNIINVCLDKGIYKIEISSLDKTLISSFYVDKNNTFIFSFNNIENQLFLLTDSNYRNLPIEYGLLTFI